MLNLAAVRASGSKPRIHGNGSIQLDLTATTRLHVWADRVSKQTTPTPIHDHVFTFESRVIVGRLLNVIYEFTEHFKQSPTAEFRLYFSQAREGGDTILVPSAIYGSITPVKTDMVMAATVMGGNTYTMPRFRFHETIPLDGPVATIITEHSHTQNDRDGGPRVLVPRGQEPDNEFNRYRIMPESLLWSIIEETLAGRTRR